MNPFRLAWLTLNVLVFVPAIVLCSLLSAKKLGARLIQAGSRAILHSLGIELLVSGSEHIPRHGMVIAASHSSLLDTFIYPAILPSSLCMVGKTELQKLPFMSFGFHRLGHIFVDRSGSRAALEAFFQQVASLDKSRLLFIHPEGTRSTTGHIGLFKRGVGRAAMMREQPVLPIVSFGGEKLWPKGRFLPRPGLIRLAIGEPIQALEGETDKLYSERIRSHMIIMHKRLQAEAAQVGGLFHEKGDRS